MPSVSARPIFLGQNQPHFLAKQPPVFAGAAGSPGLLSAIYRSDATRTLAEDILGFGLLRTTLDLFRQFLYEKTATGEATLNIPAARERVIREIGCIFSANFMAGLLAVTISEIGTKPNYFNHFARKETRHLFEEIAKTSKTEEQFLQAISGKLYPSKAKEIFQQLEQAAKAVGTAESKSAYAETAIKIARLINPKSGVLDSEIKLGKHTWQGPLDELVQDCAEFLKFTKGPHNGGQSWQKFAQETLTRTKKMSRWLLPFSIISAMAATVVVPYANNWLTRKINGIKSYPGTLGLTQSQQVEAKDERDPWYKQLFPYVSKCFEKGNIMPLLITYIPLPFAIGLVDNNALAAMRLKDAFNFGKNWRNIGSLFQFRKGLPFSTFQQIAALCALVCSARVVTSRDKIEMRERLVDAYGSWVIWIVATPWVKKGFAKFWDEKYGTKLLKQAGKHTTFRREIEIEKMLPKAIAKKTLAIYKKMNHTTFAATLILLGLIEPLIAIKWTEWQVNSAKKQAKLEAQKAKQFSPTFQWQTFNHDFSRAAS